MKLFLLSHHLLPSHKQKFVELIGKTKVDKALFISAAAVPYCKDHSKPGWLLESIEMMKEFTHVLKETTLENGTWIPNELSSYQFIYIGGGNSFYLAYRLSETGMGEKIKSFIKQGGVYVGSSAGAIILMDTIEPFAAADQPEEAPKICPGLGIIDFALIPHVDNEQYKSIMIDIKNDYKQKGYPIMELKDDQILLVNGEAKEII